eukprot:2812885-Prorocentrum_lima.AAC.1
MDLAKKSSAVTSCGIHRCFTLVATMPCRTSATPKTSRGSLPPTSRRNPSYNDLAPTTAK